jgi:glycosyltransferase involved in cell wall biosynthesis
MSFLEAISNRTSMPEQSHLPAKSNVADKMEEIERLTRTISDLRSLGRMVTEDAENEITRLRHLIFAREEKIRAMQRSASWRLTAPLRALRRFFLDGRLKRTALPVDPTRIPAIYFAHCPTDFDESREYSYNFEYPRSWSGLCGRIRIQGWCFATIGPAPRFIRAQIGERSYTGVYGTPRGDVAIHHARFPDAARSGFHIDLTIEPGDHNVVIELSTDERSWKRLLVRSLCSPNDDYDRWVRTYDSLSLEVVTDIRDRLGQLARRPLVSVVMPVYNTPEKWLERAITSVREQLYSNWELCIADDASTATHIRPLLEKAAGDDRRIKVVFREKNGHISNSSNSALSLATGDYVALLDHDDELPAHALAFIAMEIDQFPDAGLIYSDEDKLDQEGRRHGPYFKPDWNPDLLRAQNYICHLAVYRTSLIRELGGFRAGYEGAQDWDLVLRASERLAPEQIRHIPRILYHWRAIEGSTALEVSEKKYVNSASEKLLTDHFARIRVKAAVEPVHGHYWRTRYALPTPVPRVSLIIPTRNGLDVLRACVESLLGKTSYPDFEVIVVDNDSDDPATLAFLRDLPRDRRCRVVHYGGPFSFSAINNFAVSQTEAPIIGLLNNDLEAIDGSWLEEMVGLAARPDVGCVGAKLYYPDGRIQHAGVVLGIGRFAGHIWQGHPRQTHGMGFRACLQQTISAVTAACLVVRREVYQEVGGLDETDFKVGLNDVDFCLKVREAGYRNVFTPFAELYHHESASRGYEDTPEKQDRLRKEVARLQQKWGDALLFDPAYNPNLTLESVDGGLAFPPRVGCALPQPGSR